MKDRRPLHVRYRPTTLDDVLGQKHIVGSLRSVLKGNAIPHSYLFTGPSGCGKTTLARILASDLGCSDAGVTELDAATYSGIDLMREVTQGMRYRQIGEKPNKMVIVDECHALSKQTWQSLLLAIEEPPRHAFWALCTTESFKVPKTIKTRCHAYEVKTLGSNELYDHLEAVAKAEGYDVPEDIIQLATKQAWGSVRQGLVNLSAVRHCDDRKQAAEVLRTVEEEGEIVDLARLLVSGRATLTSFLAAARPLSDKDPEGFRIVITSYVSTVMWSTTNEKTQDKLLAILEAFCTPFNSTDKWAQVQLAAGRLLRG